MSSGNHGKGIATHPPVCPPGYKRNVGSGEKSHKAECAQPCTLPFASFGSPQPGKAKVWRMRKGSDAGGDGGPYGLEMAKEEEERG
jgi:hypothetical protein